MKCQVFAPLLLLFALPAVAAPSSDQVRETMHRAVEFFHGELAVEGGYVYYYSPDLERRLGEGVAGPTQVWVQPPGTPTVGAAFLAAWRATGEDAFLRAARDAGGALAYGQLESGGWRNAIDFDPASRGADQYRNGRGRGKNYSTLDDDITQSALRFLIHLDQALDGGDPAIRDAVDYGLERLLAAQFPNGAFPQVWRGPVAKHPVVPARYPEHDWRTEGRIKEYWDQYTLNDGLADSVTETLVVAAKRFPERDEIAGALRSLGDFLILAQMPEPQRGWAQQYDFEMNPIWARKFEPAAIAGRESEDVMFALLEIAAFTGDRRFLEPIVSGVKYLESSLLPDGRLARYYELETNRPLYLERNGDVYSLTHDDSKLPRHYGWKSPNRLERIKDGYRAVAAGRPLPDGPKEGPAIADIVDSLDDRGRWISIYSGERLVGQPKFRDGEAYLSSAVFARNLERLSTHLSPEALEPIHGERP